MPVPFVADEGRGRPVLLVHGQPGLSDDWAEVAARLDDHRLLAPDRPGYGRSGGATRTMAGNADVLAEVLVGHRAAPATVVGHSYGGGIAVLLAARRPDLVAGLVLVGSTGLAGSLNVVDRAMAAPVLGDALGAVGLFALGRVLPHLRPKAREGSSVALQWMRASLPDAAYGAVSSAPDARVWRSFVAEQRALLREIPTVEAALASVRVPTVVVSGAWDVVVPPRVSIGIAAAIPGSELVTVRRVGHFVPRDAPEVVAQAVRTVEARADAVADGVADGDEDTGT